MMKRLENVIKTSRPLSCEVIEQLKKEYVEIQVEQKINDYGFCYMFIYDCYVEC